MAFPSPFYSKSQLICIFANAFLLASDTWLKRKAERHAFPHCNVCAASPPITRTCLKRFIAFSNNSSTKRPLQKAAVFAPFARKFPSPETEDDYLQGVSCSCSCKWRARMPSITIRQLSSKALDSQGQTPLSLLQESMVSSGLLPSCLPWRMSWTGLAGLGH